MVLKTTTTTTTRTKMEAKLFKTLAWKKEPHSSYEHFVIISVVYRVKAMQNCCHFVNKFLVDHRNDVKKSKKEYRRWKIYHFLFVKRIISQD